MERLAIRGGPRAINHSFKRYNSFGPEELAAAKDVIESGVLSQFVGCWEPDFYGGPKVQQLERLWERHFEVKHAVTVNSWTSGLIAAVGAIGIEPGDEVIVPPWTMSASAAAILHWNAIPVFADIEPETFCLDPDAVESQVSPFTRAIMAVDIFGQSADVDALRAIAEQHGLRIISDAAQAPWVKYKGRPTGTLGNVGGYSLNYHKHIHTGEGGILVTNDDQVAERARLIRNHAEAVVGDKGATDLANLIGYNFRLGEIESAIGIEQLKKLGRRVGDRQRVAARLTAGLGELPGLTTPVVRAECTHAYYMYPIILDVEQLGVTRAHLFSALQAEGVVGLAMGYQNLHLQPLYQQKIAYGRHGFPWSSEICKRKIDYRKGICPVAERLHDSSYMALEICMYQFENAEIDMIVSAFHKIWSHLGSLRAAA